MSVLFASSIVLLLLDQWSKKSVQQFASHPAFCSPFVQIRLIHNWNRFYRSPSLRIAMVFLWFLALSSTLILWRSGSWFRSEISLAGVGMALGGAAGNLLDILRHQRVVDFIDLGWWPVFNLADIGIVGGLLLAFWR